jgi:hypothetical protein
LLKYLTDIYVGSFEDGILNQKFLFTPCAFSDKDELSGKELL